MIEATVIRLFDAPTQQEIYDATMRTELFFGERLALVEWADAWGDGGTVSVETEYERKQFIDEQCFDNLHQFQQWFVDELIFGDPSGSIDRVLRFVDADRKMGN